MEDPEPKNSQSDTPGHLPALHQQPPTPQCSSPAPSPLLLVLSRVPREQTWAGKARCHLLSEETSATKAVWQRGWHHPVPALSARETLEHSNQEIPSAEELKQGRLFPKNLFQDLPHTRGPLGVLLTVSPCPGDAGSLWMLPWKGPQEKPSGRLLRVRSRLCPSCTSRASSSAGRHAQHQRDAPQTQTQTPKPGVRGRRGRSASHPRTQSRSSFRA